MIFRITAKLGKKIGVTPSQVLPADLNPFTDWSARLFRADRTQYILITNTASLYSVVTYGKGITSGCGFLDRATSCIGEFMRDDGHEFFHQRFVVPATGRAWFSKALNHAVTGSMNDMEYNAKFHLASGEVPPYDVSFLLNRIPMSTIGYQSPRQALQALKPLA